MAKAIWWLSVIICALVNHINPYHMEEIPFVVNHYYTSTLGVDDPAAIYASFFAMDDALYQPCNATNHVLTASEGKSFAPGVTKMRSYFFPISETTFADETAAYTYSVPEGIVVPIIAPDNGYIITDPASSVDSTVMSFKLSLTGHTIMLSDMDHWYCCHGHRKYNGVGYKHCAISKDSFANKTIQQGQVIGYANSKTKIAIIDEEGNSVSFDDFFKCGPWKTTLEESYRKQLEEQKQTAQTS